MAGYQNISDWLCILQFFVPSQRAKRCARQMASPIVVTPPCVWLHNYMQENLTCMRLCWKLLLNALTVSPWQREGSWCIRWSLIWEWNAENTWEPLVYPCWRNGSLSFFVFLWRKIFSEIWNWEVFFPLVKKNQTNFVFLSFIFLLFSCKQAPDKANQRMQNNH